VPTYDPTVVYGAWPYPSYPPYYYYPPGYVAGAALVGFTAGVIIGGALWGNCNWGGGNVNVNVNRYNNFNRTNISNGNWQHNVNRRGAVPYRDNRTAQQYNRGASPNAGTRDAYRGRDSGQSPARAEGGRASAGSLDGSAGGSLDRGGGSSVDRGYDRTGYGGSAGRDSSGTRNGSAFDSGSRAQTRDYSSRGASSLNSSRGGGGASAGARAGGGGARGGGGGGRGGGRR
jgi:hypothetical protein